MKRILIEIGVYSWVLAQAGDEAELMRMFKNDFEKLMRLCAEGV